MITRPQYRSFHSAALLFLVLLAPPARHALETSMTAHMLVQIPLLVVVGWLLVPVLPARVAATTADWNHRGITGLVLATLAGAFWMLPRALDAAITDPLVDAAKYLSIPVLIGLTFGLSWPRAGFIVRGVFLLEFIATFFRLGWLYSIWPDRLCNNYLLGDQQRLGHYMILIGATLFFWIAGTLLWGRMDSLTQARPPSPRTDAGT